MNSRLNVLIAASTLGISVSVMALVADQPEKPATQPERRDSSTEQSQPTADRKSSRDEMGRASAKVTQEMLDRAINGWESKQLEAVRSTTKKHGMPSDVGPNVVIWHDAKPFKKIAVFREAVDHAFPVPHPDFLMHTISYRIDSERVSDLIASDGSLQVDRTGGCLSAKCDTEAHNVLSLNLANDVLTGKMSVQQARDEHAKIAMGEKQGKSHPYLEELQFEPQNKESARDADKSHTPAGSSTKDPAARGVNEPKRPK
ncbi:MAG: hypothetical protein H7Y88_06055 [Phycisphaerales bacterium]|nr:hypothetical protein [Phycisphaerales bacterium]